MTIMKNILIPLLFCKYTDIVQIYDSCKLAKLFVSVGCCSIIRVKNKNGKNIMNMIKVGVGVVTHYSR